MVRARVAVHADAGWSGGRSGARCGRVCRQHPSRRARPGRALPQGGRRDGRAFSGGAVAGARRAPRLRDRAGPRPRHAPSRATGRELRAAATRARRRRNTRDGSVVGPNPRALGRAPHRELGGGAQPLPVVTANTLWSGAVTWSIPAAALRTTVGGAIAPLPSGFHT